MTTTLKSKKIDDGDCLTIILEPPHVFAVPAPIPPQQQRKQQQRKPELLECSEPGMDGMSIVEFDNRQCQSKQPKISQIQSFFVGNPRSALGLQLKGIVEAHEALRLIYERLSMAHERTSAIRRRKAELLGTKSQVVYVAQDGEDSVPDRVAIKRYWLLERRDAMCNRDLLTWELLNAALQRLAKPERTERLLQQANLVVQLNEGKETLATVLGSLILSKSLVYRVEKIYLAQVSVPPVRCEILSVAETMIREIEEMRVVADSCNAETKELRLEAGRIYGDTKKRHEWLSDSATKLGLTLFVTATHRIAKLPAPLAGITVTDAQQTLSAVLESQHRLVYRKPMTALETTAKMLSGGNFLTHMREACGESLEKKLRSSAVANFRWTVTGLQEHTEERE